MSSETSEIVIADSTCLIVLSKIGSLELLHQTYGTIIITPEIHEEFAEELRSWIRVVDLAIMNVPRMPSSLGRGEKSAIHLAYNSADSSILILDDWNARTFAAKLGLDIIGTMGVLLEAKALGTIESVSPFIEKIRNTNFYLDDELVAKVLHLADE